ncbi:hypothetical protein [Caulobacter sp.]|uniref:hypothetical protein n=1 Tax=Caulobacter sp. TaxID=78 RepID=UPI0025BD4FEF|nr:hypothetical protein [Caulobacter sp.]
MPHRPNPPAMMVMPSNNSPARASTASVFTLSTMVSPLSDFARSCWRTVSPELQRNSTLDEIISGRANRCPTLTPAP